MSIDSQILSDRARAEAARDATETLKGDVESTVDQAVIDIEDARTTALSNIGDAETSAISDINDARDAGITAVEEARDQGAGAVETARDDAITAINDLLSGLETVKDETETARDETVAISQIISGGLAFSLESETDDFLEIIAYNPATIEDKSDVITVGDQDYDIEYIELTTID